ncbi:ABC transporter C family member 12-like isoform X1, partial [Argonauta hians]
RIIVCDPSSQWLSGADQVVVMDAGRIVVSGTFSQVRHTTHFQQLLSPHTVTPFGQQQQQQQQQQRWSSEHSAATKKHLKWQKLSKVLLCQRSVVEAARKGVKSMEESRSFRRFFSYQANSRISSASKSIALEKSRRMYMEGSCVLLDSVRTDETLKTYALKSREFRKYCGIVGWLSIAVTLLLAMLYQITKVASSKLLEDWMDSSINETHPSENWWMDSPSNTTHPSNTLFFLYGSFGLTQALWLGLFFVSTTVFATRASKTIHCKMLQCVLYWPIGSFTANSNSELEYTFFNHLTEVDEGLQCTYKMWANALFDILATFTLISATQYYLFPIILLLIILIWMQMRLYIPVRVKLQQMYYQCTSNLLGHLSETEDGADVIAAFNNEGNFIKKNNALVDQLQRYYYTIMSAKRWSGFLLQFMGSTVILFVCLYATIYPSQNSVVGLILTYLIKASKSLDWFVRMTSDMKVMKVDVQQVNSHMDPSLTEKTNIEGQPWRKLPESWPERGEINFLQFSDNCCLTDINLHIKPGQKVGIVGKSGSGKSSLVMALTKMSVGVKGKIFIDDQDIYECDPQQLRAALVIFPQECEVYSGTLRSNLDPTHSCTDDELYTAINTTGLDLNLDTDYSNDADISHGKKQLIYLTKCLLKRSKVVILDEATAKVSHKESKHLMNIIENHFADSTILCIAHKLDIVHNYDKILVMEGGRVIEYGAPQSLLKNKTSRYYNMALLANKAGLLDITLE